MTEPTRPTNEPSGELLAWQKMADTLAQASVVNRWCREISDADFKRALAHDIRCAMSSAASGAVATTPPAQPVGQGELAERIKAGFAARELIVSSESYVNDLRDLCLAALPAPAAADEPLSQGSIDAAAERVVNGALYALRARVKLELTAERARMLAAAAEEPPAAPERAQAGEVERDGHRAGCSWDGLGACPECGDEVGVANMPLTLREEAQAWLAMWPEGSISHGARARALEEFVRRWLAATRAPAAAQVVGDELIRAVEWVLTDAFCKSPEVRTSTEVTDCWLVRLEQALNAHRSRLAPPPAADGEGGKNP